MRTLSDGRERRSREEWQRIVSRFERSGLSENRFCKEQRLTRKTFRTWRQRLAEGGGTPPPFVEIAMPKPVAEEVAEPLGSGAFELSLPGGVTLRWRA